jgi:HSP20 family protein
MANNEVEKRDNREVKAEQPRRTIRPVSDIWEEDDLVLLRLEMPGVKKENLEVKVNGDSLEIHGTRQGYAGDVACIFSERRNADYRALYTLNEKIDREKIEAHMEDGVLTLSLHLKAEVKPRKIEVKAA